MAKLENQTKQVKWSKCSKRFYTALDIAIIKHDLAVINSKIKRGEIILDGETRYISKCTCGREGCFAYGAWKNNGQDFYR